MAKLTDLSQLKRSMFKEAEPVVKPVPPAGISKDQEVLDYFTKGGSHKSVSSARENAVESENESATWAAEVKRLEAKLAAVRGELDEAVNRAERAEMVAGSTQRKVEELERELTRLRSDNARLRSEAEKGAKQPVGALRVEDGQRTEPKAAGALAGLLAAPAGFAEAFAGELRELLIAILEDSLDACRNGERERRTTALEAILAANPSNGELSRRRTELKQVLKDCGYFNDARALEKLGFRLVSGKKHWKLEYADIRMPLSKTPSDYRANLNSANEMANRCF